MDRSISFSNVSGRRGGALGRLAASLAVLIALSLGGGAAAAQTAAPRRRSPSRRRGTPTS